MIVLLLGIGWLVLAVLLVFATLVAAAVAIDARPLLVVAVATALLGVTVLLQRRAAVFAA